MKAIVTSEEMKYYDTFTIETIGMPSLLLMERAADAFVHSIRDKVTKKTKAAVFAGTGNNGGDALAVGRMLAELGAAVSFFMPGNLAKASRETKKQLEILENLGFSIHDNFTEEEYDIVIDGLFGIGLTRPVGGVYEEAVHRINQMKEQGAFVAAVDIPSGICADTGKVLGCAVRADLTVTFAYGKAGHFLYPGREYTGCLQVCPIGIVGEAFTGRAPSYQTLEEEEINRLLPKRKPDGNKGTFGKVLLLSGSYNMCGAAILCGKGILRTGAGMVKIMTPDANREILQSALPEAMLCTWDGIPDEAEILKASDWADVLVAGCGIGKGEASRLALQCFLKQGKKPLILDADALNLIAEDDRLKAAVKEYEAGKLFMTPHPGELTRLLGISMETYQKSPREAVKKLADTFGCIAIGKDAVTLVAEPEKKTVYMNLTGNDGMATAGSGDVLAGIIGGLLAQGAEGCDAAVAGVYLHGKAGDLAAKAKGRYGMMALDITEFLW